MFTLAHSDYSVQTLLAGRVYSMDDVPRWYVPVYLAIKLPLIMLTGAALAMVLAASAEGSGVYLLAPDAGAQPGMKVK